MSNTVVEGSDPLLPISVVQPDVLKRCEKCCVAQPSSALSTSKKRVAAFARTRETRTLASAATRKLSCDKALVSVVRFFAQPRRLCYACFASAKFIVFTAISRQSPHRAKRRRVARAVRKCPLHESPPSEVARGWRDSRRTLATPASKIQLWRTLRSELP